MNVSFSTLQDEDNFIYGILLNWDEDGYFGQVDIRSDNGNVSIWAETMGKDFVKRLLNQLVYDAEMRE